MYNEACDQLSFSQIKDLYENHIRQSLERSDVPNILPDDDNSGNRYISEDANENDWEDEPEPEQESAAIDSVQVMETNAPFLKPSTERTFFLALLQLTETVFIPPGYGVKPEEWMDGDYPTAEILKVGKRKEIIIELPKQIWLRKAELWARALYLMIQTQEYEAMEGNNHTRQRRM